MDDTHILVNDNDNGDNGDDDNNVVHTDLPKR